jgi:hypothetical protein
MPEDVDAGGPIAYEEVAERIDLSTSSPHKCSKGTPPTRRRHNRPDGGISRRSPNTI